RAGAPATRTLLAAESPHLRLKEPSQVVGARKAWKGYKGPQGLQGQRNRSRSSFHVLDVLAVLYVLSRNFLPQAAPPPLGADSTNVTSGESAPRSLRAP